MKTQWSSVTSKFKPQIFSLHSGIELFANPPKHDVYQNLYVTGCKFLASPCCGDNFFVYFLTRWSMLATPLLMSSIYDF
jgi:hypothetical protein